MSQAALAAPSPAYSSGEQKRLTEVIFGYARRIGELQDRESLLAVIADLGRDLVKADRCSIWLADRSSNQLVTRLSHGVDPIHIMLGQGHVGRCVNSGEMVLSNHVEGAGTVSSMVDARTGYRTRNLLVVPMRSSQGEIIGAFQALNKDGGFLPEDQDLLKLAATYAASTLEAQSLRQMAEEARRLEHELEIARQVQQRLLPESKETTLCGCSLFGKCRSAHEVGGDYFTYLTPQPDCLVLAAGDVSGKGISAALMMASIQATLQGLLANVTVPLRVLVANLSQTVYENSLSSRYSTLCVMRFDTKTRILTTVNAGHCPLVLMRANGELTQIGSDGPPVGLLPSLTFTEQRHTLSSGDLLVCHSDGLSECHNNSQEIWPEEQFLGALQSLYGLTTADAAERLMASADGFADGATQHDDMTVVCLRVG